MSLKLKYAFNFQDIFKDVSFDFVYFFNYYI